MKKQRTLSNERGAILFIAIIFSLVVTSVMVFTMNMAYQRTRLVNTVGIERTEFYYHAQAGLVDAFWRLRTSTLPPGAPADLFANPARSATYFMDIDGNGISAAVVAGVSDIRVDISAVGAAAVPPAPAGLRRVTARGDNFN